MKHATRALLPKIKKYKVGGKNGFECGVLEIKESFQIDESIKKELSIFCNLPEIAIISPLSTDFYNVEFYKKGQEIAICGHACFAIAESLSDAMLEKIFLSFAGGSCLIDYDDLDSYTITIDTETDIKNVNLNLNYHKQADSVCLYDLTQDKYFIIYDKLSDFMGFNIKSDPFFANKAVLVMCELENNFHVSFYRNCIEDSLHISGLCPLLDILEMNKCEFIFKNGNAATIEKKGDKYLSSCEVIEINQQLQK